MSILLDIVIYTAIGLFAVYYWVFVMKKVRQHFGRPYYDDLPESDTKNKEERLNHKT